jgi:hypothetical protein
VKKIISLFQRNYDGDRLCRNELVPGAEWVAAGEGIATRKWDGTSCLVKDGLVYKRYDAKHGKTPPEGFIPAQDPDPKTGHWPGWLLCHKEKHEDRWHYEAAMDTDSPLRFDGTYELVGPKINGNRDGLDRHIFIAHGTQEFPDAPRDFDGLKAWLAACPIEGLVWHHPDGRMVKIKRKDFGLPWPVKAEAQPD